MKQLIPLLLILVLFSCKKNTEPIAEPIAAAELPKIISKYGYIFNDYKVIEDTIKSGESFGEILDRNHVEYPLVYKIAESVKDTFDVRRLKAGKPYTILAKKDTTEKAQVFIYRPNLSEYLVVDFTDSIQASNHKKPIKIVERMETGIINDSLSSLSLVIDSKGLDYNIVNEMADIYAWTIDFFHLQQGDSFKIMFEEKYVDDTTYVGIGKVKAAYFEHKNTPFYAFNYVTDSTKNVYDFYDHEAHNLRKQFLKAPVNFRNARISSRYNLRRRIAHYGYRVKAHRGTDFAAAHGTPIIATANGTVTKSAYARGNGNYVKIKHNSTYSTQYLHMSKRKARVGDFVKQGDVIGYVGNTGSSAGNHVCYRFWKHGRQVDPLKEKLPSAEPIKEEIKDDFLSYIIPFKDSLDNVIVN